jgi:hypothetical protein
MFICPVTAVAVGLDSIIGDEVILSSANKGCFDAKVGECWFPMSGEDNLIFLAGDSGLLISLLLRLGFLLSD